MLMQQRKHLLQHMLICLCADWAAANMGGKHDALIQLSDYGDVCCPYIIYCLNQNLKVVIKDHYSKIQEFQEIKESLHILFKMMKDSGKTGDVLWWLVIIQG